MSEDPDFYDRLARVKRRADAVQRQLFWVSIVVLVILGIALAARTAWPKTPTTGVNTALVSSMLARVPVYRDDRGDEHAAAKAAQLQEVAAAIAEASRSRVWLAAMLVAMASHETHFSLRIGRGECRRYECDPRRNRDGTLVAQAHSIWQLHRNTCSSAEAWEEARTNVHVAAREAARAIILKRGVCRRHERTGGNWVEMTFAALGDRACLSKAPGLLARAATYRRLVGTL